MTPQTLLLKENHIEFFAQKFDDAVNFKELIKNKTIGAAAEAGDKLAAKMILSLLNKIVSVHISDSYKDKIHGAVDDIIEAKGDPSQAVKSVCGMLSQIKDGSKLNPHLNNMLNALIELIEAGLNYMEEKSGAQVVNLEHKR